MLNWVKIVLINKNGETKTQKTTNFEFNGEIITTLSRITATYHHRLAQENELTIIIKVLDLTP